MKKLNRFHKHILIDAVKTTGSYNPDDSMFIFEENITPNEYYVLRCFLSFIHENKLGFGSGNIDSRFEEFKSA